MFQRILVGVEFDDALDALVGQAIELAQSSEGCCNLVHAIEPIQGGEDDPATDSFYEGLKARAAVALGEQEARVVEAGVPCESTLVVGPRWRTIVETAGTWGADLVVVGSRPTLQDGRPHLGSTSHKVFFAADCPVLALRGRPSPSGAR